MDGVSVLSKVRYGFQDMAAATVGRYPSVWALIICAMTVAIVVLAFYVGRMSKDKFMTQYGNLATGGNNPLWQNSMGDAGWGGSMHSTYQPGQSRVYGASADGPDTVAVMPIESGPACMGDASMIHNRMAAGEGMALDAAGARIAPAAKSFNEDDLEARMRGL